MFCVKCGKELQAGSAFCGFCGTRQNGAAAPAAAPASAATNKLYFEIDGVSLVNYKFTVKDANRQLRYTAKTVSEGLVTYNAKAFYPDGREAFAVRQKKALTLVAMNFEMQVNGKVVCDILQKNKFTKYVYEMPQLGLTADGDFISRKFQFTRAGKPVATVTRDMASLGTDFIIEFSDPSLEQALLAATIAIELVTAADVNRHRRR